VHSPNPCVTLKCMFEELLEHMPLGAEHPLPLPPSLTWLRLQEPTLTYMLGGTNPLHALHLHHQAHLAMLTYVFGKPRCYGNKNQLHTLHRATALAILPPFTHLAEAAGANADCSKVQRQLLDDCRWPRGPPQPIAWAKQLCKCVHPQHTAVNIHAQEAGWSGVGGTRGGEWEGDKDRRSGRDV
jgi:hypothetical protein